MVAETFPRVPIRDINTAMQDKVLFGSDYPVITPERWLRDFDRTEIKPKLRGKILKDNTARLLGLAA